MGRRIYRLFCSLNQYIIEPCFLVKPKKKKKRYQKWEGGYIDCCAL